MGEAVGVEGRHERGAGKEWGKGLGRTVFWFILFLFRRNPRKEVGR